MTPLREVLCATDIERPARAALRHAFFIAERFNASLSIVHARDPAHPGQINRYVSNERRFQQLVNEQHALERLDALVKTIPTAGTGRATTHVLEGNLAEAIVNCSDRQHSNLIVLGTNVAPDRVRDAEEPLARQLGERTIRAVLTVPHTNVSSLPRVQKILCPIERRGNGTAELIAWLVLLAHRFHAVVEVLRDRARVGLCDQGIEEPLRVAGVGTLTSTCSPGSSLAEASLERVAGGSCDLIVMSTDSQGAGSASLASVRRESLAPVLSIPSKDANSIFTSNPHGTSTDDRRSFDASAAARSLATQ